MRIKSFLTKLWRAVKSLFNKFPDNLKAAVHIGVSVTESIKIFIDSPVADILTAIIPGDIDDKIKQILRNGIPVILTNLKLTDECGSLTDPQEITACAVKTIQHLDGDIKSAFLHNLSILITQLAADENLSWSDAVCIVEWYYQHKFKVSGN